MNPSLEKLLRSAWVVSLLLATSPVFAQRFITTVSGRDWAFPGRTVPSLEAPTGESWGGVFDDAGNYYFSDQDNHLVYRVTPEGRLHVIAGNGFAGFSGDGGLATRASLNEPRGIALDRQGGVLFVDFNNQRIRRIARDGTISTYAGGGQSVLGRIGGIARDEGGIVYASILTGARVVRITPDGTVTPIGGIGITGPIDYPVQVALDGGGNLYIACLRQHRIQRLGTDGALTTVAGTGTQGFSGDGGLATAAQLSNPSGVALDRAGNLLIADTGNRRVRRVGSNGIITTIAGNGEQTATGDGGPALDAGLMLPMTLAVRSDGAIAMAGAGNRRIRLIETDGTISTLAGNGRFRSSGDGPASAASFVDPGGIALDGDGNLLIAEPLTNRVRRLTRQGTVETVAGNGVAGLQGDGGPARLASLNRPSDVAFHRPTGTIVIFDEGNQRGRIITPDGRIQSSALPAQLFALNPFELNSFLRFGRPFNLTSLSFDPAGALYGTFGTGISRTTNPDGSRQFSVSIVSTNGLARIPSPGVFQFLSATALSSAVPGDNSYAPLATTFDFAGNQFVSTISRLFRSPPSGTFAGFGRQIGGAMTGLTTDQEGNVYTAGFFEGSVYRLDPSGAEVRIAGTGSVGNDGDGGLATDARLSPSRLVVDDSGIVYVLSDEYIRAILTEAASVTSDRTAIALTADAGGALTAPSQVTLRSSIDGVPFTAEARTDSGGNWLRLSPAEGRSPRILEITADPADLSPAQYTGTITVRVPNARPDTLTVRVALNVRPAPAPALELDRRSMAFPFARNGTARTQSLRVSNTGGGRLDFRASARPTTGGNWLTVTPASGQATPRQSALIAVTANPAGLAPGTYSGTVEVNAQSIPVVMTVSDRDQILTLTQSGLSFLAVAGGGVVPPQSFAILNLGTGALRWQVSTSTLDGGPGWLKVSATEGTTGGGERGGAEIIVTVNQQGLSPRRYFGAVQVNSGDVPNAPQQVTVVLDVLPSDSNPGSVLQPAELAFTAVSGATPGSLESQIFNLTPGAVGYRSSSSGNWFAFSPADGKVDPQTPLTLAVQPRPNLAPSEYRGNVTLQFTDGTVRTLALSHVVTAPPAAGRSAEGCMPTKLLLAVRTIGQAFTVPAGAPGAIDVEVKDDCNQPLEEGSVVASFSNGDAPVSLLSLNNGRWQATWRPQGSAAGVNIRVEATAPNSPLTANTTIAAFVTGQLDPPAFRAEGVVSSATAVSFAPLAPRSLVTIFGERLADSIATADSTPLPDRLEEVQVIMSGRRLPLFYASPKQLNAVVPEDLPANTVHQLVVRRGSALSQPVAVNVAPAQPALFGAGSGRALAVAARGNTQFTVTPESPAQRGDVLILYGSGFGAVDAALAAGAASSTTQLVRVAQPVRVRIGNVEARVDFAGLAPGFVGLYQANVVIPEGAPLGDAVPIVVEAGGQSSPALTVPIR